MNGFPKGSARFAAVTLAASFLGLAVSSPTVAATYRSIDGTGNNPVQFEWGSTNETLLRIGPIAYADGISAPRSLFRSARFISNRVVAQTTPDRRLSDRQLSAMVAAWGEFVAHDLGLTVGARPPEPFGIKVPRGDPSFDPGGTGTEVIPYNRSVPVPGTGTSTSNPRQQPNATTSFIDASMIYGSSDVVARKLRTFSGGHLKTQTIAGLGTFLPLNDAATFPDGTLPMTNDAQMVLDEQLFAAGDIRANESPALAALHTLFVREHNRLSAALQADNPLLSDETLYQLARREVGAEIQAITYNEWIPAVLGPNALPAYTGYKANVNPGLAHEFGAAAFRLGPTLLGDAVKFIDNDGLPVAGDVPQNMAAFDPALVSVNGIGPILKYLATDNSSEVDSSLVDPVRNFLFTAPGAVSFDPAALDIQRGRDHGLAGYNRVRVAYGLPAVTGFSQVTSNLGLRLRLQTLYGNVNNIDAWVGGFAEDHVPGTSTGPLVRASLIDQFTRLRDGDLFFYKNPNSPLPFSAADQAFLENDRSLADLIRLNTSADVVQDNIFFFRVSISGEVFRDKDRDGRHDSGEAGLAGRTVTLVAIENGQPEVRATDVTDANGRYSFTVFDGLTVGDYQVIETLPAGWIATSPLARSVNLPRGETLLDVDFGNVKSPPLTPPGEAP